MLYKEVLHVLLAILVMGLAVSISTLTPDILIKSFIFFLIIFIVNIFAKKLTAYYLECSVETKIWHVQRYWFRDSNHLKYPIATGIIFPLLISVLSLGTFYWLATTQSEISARRARVARRHDFYSYSELTEYHVGIIPAAGIFAVIVLAFFAYLINEPELGKLAIFFACFNMLPLGQLDGSKVFFGSVRLWFVLAAVCLIALGYAVFLI